mmetsp:Transcript_27637/g.36261  ORF Transcript_27637/g.36261 Transcript_27637/m.36261 type:complete len:315 (-) Transcript_27637:296-1240(-)
MEHQTYRFRSSIWKVSKLTALIFASTTTSFHAPLQPTNSRSLKNSAIDAVDLKDLEKAHDIQKPNGLFAVYKPKDWTSSDVVTKIRNTVSKEIRMRTNQRVKIKCGHGGTLDPLATGVLVIGLGTGCKVLNHYLKGAKAYRAVALLGKEMDTLDCTGKEIGSAPYDHVTWELLQEVLPNFRGDIMQVPPMYSALKKDGKKLYELARAGEEIEREARPVHIAQLELLKETQCSITGEERPLELPSFGLQIECGGGTYVRSLISDIAKECNSMAHMTALERTQQGPFTLQDCLHKDDWNLDTIRSVLVDPKSLNEE